MMADDRSREELLLYIDNLERRCAVCAANPDMSVFDDLDQPVYVVSMDTHEVLYANKTLTGLFGTVVGQKCHDVFQGLPLPCDFCSDPKVRRAGSLYVWEFQNLLNGRWYRCLDHGIVWGNGEVVKLEVAVDITDLKEAQEKQEEEIAFLNSAIGAVVRGL